MLASYGIKKSLDGNEIIRGVDIEVEPGKITVLIGPSGSGKTTLLKSLSLLELPDSGRIVIDSDIYQFPLASKEVIKYPWPQVTVVFQQLFLWPHLTLYQNITMPIRKRAKIGTSYLNELVRLFDMEDFINRYPNEVSLGQKQRTALVRSLVLNPTYILMDEITSALDVEQISKILTHLQFLKAQGIGVLITTHLIGFARRAADKVFFMENGIILESGGSELIDMPQNPRVKKFLSVIESAS
jgi:ABC-type polar amino acid transport system ATPase subunit